MLFIGLILALVLSAFTALSWHYAHQVLHPPRQIACQTPAELAVEAQRVEFPSRDGICLRGWWMPVSHARGTIVFSHGYGGDCSPDLENADWLTRAGYNLLYFDHRAHGTSDGTLTTLGYLETRDLLGALDFLRARGIDKVGVVGFSMGGSVALQTAPLTDAIQCVIVDCTFADLRTLLVHNAPQVRVPRWFAPIGVIGVLACASLQARCNLFTHTPEKSIGRIAPRPVLIIQAGNDELVPASETARLYAAAREPKALWRVDGALHRAVDKLVREEYERRIAAFFDEYLASPSQVIEAADRFTAQHREQASQAGLSRAAD